MSYSVFTQGSATFVVNGVIRNELKTGKHIDLHVKDMCKTCATLSASEIVCDNSKVNTFKHPKCRHDNIIIINTGVTLNSYPSI